MKIYPRGILTPCYHSTSKAAAIASSLHDIPLPRRRQRNGVLRQRMGREGGKQCLVCAYERERGRGESGSSFTPPFTRYIFSLHTVAWRDFEAWLSSPVSVFAYSLSLFFLFPNWPLHFSSFFTSSVFLNPYSDYLFHVWHLWTFNLAGGNFFPFTSLFLFLI